MTQNIEPTDSEITALLEPLVYVAPRDTAAAQRGRDLFLAEVDRMALADPVTPLRQIGMWFSQISLTGGFSLRRQISPLSAGVALIIVLTFLFGGAWATASAAENALPGDALYPVKTMVEETRIALSRDAARDVELHVRFAEERLDEIEALIEAGRFDDIDTATEQAEFHIQEAINNLALVSPGDPALVQRLSERIAKTLGRYHQVLSGLLTLVPEDLQTEIREGLDFSGQFDAGQDNNPDDVGGPGADHEGGDNNNDDGNDNENENGNGNENGNDDGNDNGKDDGNDNGNDDGNDNGNDNDNENDDGDDDDDDDDDEDDEDNENDDDDDDDNE